MENEGLHDAGQRKQEEIAKYLVNVFPKFPLGTLAGQPMTKSMSSRSRRARRSVGPRSRTWSKGVPKRELAVEQCGLGGKGARYLSVLLERKNSKMVSETARVRDPDVMDHVGQARGTLAASGEPSA